MSKAPKIHKIREIQFPKFEQRVLRNGIPVYLLHKSQHDLIKIEISFYAGRPFENQQLAGISTMRMLKEGSHKHTGSEIDEILDYCGASLNMPVHLDTSHIILYSLSKHLNRLLPLFGEMLCQPTFPEDDLERFKRNNIERLKVELQKVDTLAYRKFTEHIFGTDHPYGYNSSSSKYQALDQSVCQKHFDKNYTAANCQLYISGNCNNEAWALIDQYLGAIPQGQKNELQLPDLQSLQGKRIEMPSKHQVAIRMGKRLFNKAHPDFHKMSILSTMLGGYFGSRLMSNIREEKGYTYNIYSTCDSMIGDGYFYIGTEVDPKFEKPTIEEINREISKLQEEPPALQEMDMVRNYMMGNLLTALDGPFKAMDIMKTINIEGLDADFMDRMVDCILSVKPLELTEMARKHLNLDSLTSVIVG